MHPFILLITLYASAAASGPSKLVDKVCKQSSSYNFCVKSLYSDSRTPDADDYTLAFVSVGLAYVNATSTRDHISRLLNNDVKHKQALQRCARNYDRAVSFLGMADNDLNSETYFELVDLAGNASLAATDCEAALKGIPSAPLGSRNKDLNGLCEICATIGKLFMGLLL